MITFIRTRNIDLIEMVANSPEIQLGGSNGCWFNYNPEELYFSVEVHGEFAGIVRALEVQSKSFECHAMFIKSMRGFSKDIGMAFWDFFFKNYDAACVYSMASDKFRYGKLYCALIGLKRVGVMPKFFNGETNVTIYAATREDLQNGK